MRTRIRASLFLLAACSLLLVALLRDEVLRARMMYHDRARRLLRIELVSRRELHSHRLLRLQQREQLHLVRQIRTRRISEGEARAAVLLVEEVADVRRVFARDAELLAHALVVILGEGFRGLDAEAVEVQVARVLVRVEELLGDLRGLVTDGDKRQADHVELARTLRQEEVADTQPSSFFLPREGEALNLGGSTGLQPGGTRVHISLGFSPGRALRRVEDDVVP